MKLRITIPLVLMVDGDSYNAEYGTNDSREDIIDDIEQRVLAFVDNGFAPFTFVTDSFIELDQ